MSTITVRLNSQEKEEFEEYAKLMGMPLSTLFKLALQEKLEEEFDMKLIKEYESEYDTEEYTIDEVKEQLRL